VQRLPFSPTPRRRSLAIVGPAAILLTAAVALFWLGPEYRAALATSLIGVTLCLSVVVVTGYVGQLSLAPMAFAGISAFVVADLSTDRGWPFPWPIIAGGVVAALVGVIVAVPALRIRGVNLAIVTLAFGVTMDRFVFDNPLVNGGLTGAPVDSPGFVEQSNSSTFLLFGSFEVGDGKQPNVMSAVFCLLIAAVLCYAVAVLRRSQLGRQMVAVRANERAAAAAGVDVARTKAIAFAISAFVAGVGGAVLAYRAGGVSQSRFTYDQSLLLFAFAYIGGISRISGAVVGGLLTSGGVVFVVLDRVFGVPSEFTLLLGGISLIVTVIVHPEGIAAKLTPKRFTAVREPVDGEEPPGAPDAPEPSADRAAVVS
jgi:branched-chain amino acid transport system permease protein